MRLSIKTHLRYTTQKPCDVLLQIEAMSDDVQTCHSTRFVLTPDADQSTIAGEEGLGVRRWIKAGTSFECRYETLVDIARNVAPLEGLPQTSLMQIPSDVVKYLMPSRYCHSELFLDFVAGQFGMLKGGTMVLAIRDWIAGNFTYDIFASHAGTTATDTFASLRGVCRDYAHVMIALTRAAGIPARFVSAYAPDVDPQDFHAVVEVYLDGSWHIVDATGMAKPEDVARICVGRDAADASFMTSYGWMDLQDQSVTVARSQ